MLGQRPYVHRPQSRSACVWCSLDSIGRRAAVQTPATDYLQDRLFVTHKSDAKYAKTVDAGLKVLVLISMKTSDPSTTMALCEAFGMTNDPGLRIPAQNAVNLIIKSQHADGGWGNDRQMGRYPLDTGWQIQALRSAQLAGLSVPKEVTANAIKYLDSRARPATASDLLCRQYLG